MSELKPVEKFTFPPMSEEEKRTFCERSDALLAAVKAKTTRPPPMISNAPHMLLCIPIRSNSSAKPVIDEATRRMTAAFRTAGDGNGFPGYHDCPCGVWAPYAVYAIGTIRTHALCVHYLAFHRGDIPADQLERVMALPFGEEEPNADELRQPRCQA